MGRAERQREKEREERGCRGAGNGVERRNRESERSNRNGTSDTRLPVVDKIG